jgi:DNA-binding IclR family transcriptional regulator
VIPALITLAHACQESASFHVRNGNTRLCIYRVNAEHSIVDNVHTGDSLPLERGAPGKVLLAWSGDASPESAEIRGKGYAMSFGDRDPLCAAVSVPVFKFENELCGAVSVSGPKTRFTARYAREILPRVVAAATHMSAGLGAAPSKQAAKPRRAAEPVAVRATPLAYH